MLNDARAERMEYKFIHKGDWERQKRSILSVENKCFPREERTYLSIFREFINDIEPFTLIVRDGRKAIGYFMCAPLEECGDDMKRWDKNFGKRNTLYVFSIGVIPEYRHAGVGHEMMKKLIREAYKSYDRITLHTRNETFKTMCIRYKFGIIRQGIMDGHKMTYMGRWLI